MTGEQLSMDGGDGFVGWTGPRGVLRPPEDVELGTLDAAVRSLGIGAKVELFYAPETSKTLTVERFGDAPDWCPLEQKPTEVGVVLSGYGTTYYLTSDGAVVPMLRWPSNNGIGIWALKRIETGETIYAEKTAADLLGDDLR